MRSYDYAHKRPDGPTTATLFGKDYAPRNRITHGSIARNGARWDTMVRVRRAKKPNKLVLGLRSGHVLPSHHRAATASHNPRSEIVCVCVEDRLRRVHLTTHGGKEVCGARSIVVKALPSHKDQLTQKSQGDSAHRVFRLNEDNDPRDSTGQRAEWCKRPDVSLFFENLLKVEHCPPRKLNSYVSPKICSNPCPRQNSKVPWAHGPRFHP